MQVQVWSRLGDRGTRHSAERSGDLWQGYARSQGLLGCRGDSEGTAQALGGSMARLGKVRRAGAWKQ
jgi:hypothetical protein